jgi:hypothetical protein
VNAFGIGGGRIYVNAGLLAEADREGEVAAVLAHEIGHQVRRHVAKQISRQTVFDNLARVAVGSNASQWINLATGLGITTGHGPRGRASDGDGGFMPRAGYDPREAIAIFAMPALSRPRPRPGQSCFRLTRRRGSAKRRSARPSKASACRRPDPRFGPFGRALHGPRRCHAASRVSARRFGARTFADPARRKCPQMKSTPSEAKI